MKSAEKHRWSLATVVGLLAFVLSVVVGQLEAQVIYGCYKSVAVSYYIDPGVNTPGSKCWYDCVPEEGVLQDCDCGKKFQYCTVKQVKADCTRGTITLVNGVLTCLGNTTTETVTLNNKSLSGTCPNPAQINCP